MNASFRDTMRAGIKIHVMATGIKDGYLTIMNLLRDKSPSGEPAPSSLPYSLLGIILQYAGLLPSNIKLNIGKRDIARTSSTDLEGKGRPSIIHLTLNPARNGNRLYKVLSTNNK